MVASRTVTTRRGFNGLGHHPQLVRDPPDRRQVVPVSAGFTCLAWSRRPPLPPRVRASLLTPVHNSVLIRAPRRSLGSLEEKPAKAPAPIGLGMKAGWPVRATIVPIGDAAPSIKACMIDCLHERHVQEPHH